MSRACWLWPTWRAVVALAVLVSMAWAGPADKPDKGRELLLRGRYTELREWLAPRLGREPPRPGLVRLAARADWEQGRFQDSLTRLHEALATRPDAPGVAALLAEIQVGLGRYSDALETVGGLLERDPDHLAARYWKGRALQGLGKLAEADEIFAGFVAFYNLHSDTLTNGPALWLVGRGVTEHLLYNAKDFVAQRGLQSQFSFILNTIYADVALNDPYYWPAAVAAGELLLGRYNRPEATAEFKRALGINPNAAEALLGLALCALADHKLEAAEKHLADALEKNPALVDALAVQAYMKLAEGQWSAFEAAIQKALEVHPRHLGALGLKGAAALVRNRRADYEALARQTAPEGATPADFYFWAGRGCEQRRKFTLAEPLYRKAIQAADHLANPRTQLGMLYMRMGHDDKARTVLDESFKRDPFNVRTSNVRKLLRRMQKYQTFRTPHFRLRLDPQRDGLMAPYAIEYLEAQYGPMVKRFGFEPPGRTPVEIFDEHRWFSARTIGLPWIATIGASTGMVVAMTSPRAMRRPFNWARVLKHELVHIITLQQTDFNIPHWYTEALAVLAEDQPRHDAWNRLLVQVVRDGKLLNLKTIDRAFQRPKHPAERQLAYLQAELYAEFMLARFGNDSLKRLLAAYQKGLSTKKAIRQSFGVSVEAFEKAFREHAADEAAKIHLPEPIAIRPLTVVRKAAATQPENMDLKTELALALVRRRQWGAARRAASAVLAKKPGDPLASIALARIELVTDDFAAARDLLAKALDQAPERLRPAILRPLAEAYMGTGEHKQALGALRMGRRLDPHSTTWLRGLATVYGKLGDAEHQREALEQWAAADMNALGPRRQLLEMALARKDYAAAVRFGRMALEISLFDPILHAKVGQAFVGAGDYTRALREYTSASRLDAKNVTWLVESARCLKRLGRRDDAIATLRKALALEPDDAEAKKLLANFEGQPTATKDAPAPSTAPAK